MWWMRSHSRSLYFKASRHNLILLSTSLIPSNASHCQLGGTHRWSTNWSWASRAISNAVTPPRHWKSSSSSMFMIYTKPPPYPDLGGCRFFDIGDIGDTSQTCILSSKLHDSASSRNGRVLIAPRQCVPNLACDTRVCVDQPMFGYSNIPFGQVWVLQDREDRMSRIRAVVESYRSW